MEAGNRRSLETVGGRWDRKKKCWTEAGPERCKLLELRLHRGQEESIRWMVDWLRRFVSNNWKGTERVVGDADRWAAVG